MPSSRRRRKRAVGLEPVERPGDRLVGAGVDGKRLPSGWARASQAWATNAESRIAATAPAAARSSPRAAARRPAAEIAPPSDALGRSAQLGRRREIDSEADDDPVAAALEQDPGELFAEQHHVVGPFQHQRAGRAAAASMASISARPAASDRRLRQADRRAQLDQRAAVEIAAAAIPTSGPGGPCPACCSSATSQSPSTARSSAIRSALVEPVRSTMRMRRQNSVPAARSLSAPSGPISR